jgi:hypothetical protein
MFQDNMSENSINFLNSMQMNEASAPPAYHTVESAHELKRLYETAELKHREEKTDARPAGEVVRKQYVGALPLKERDQLIALVNLNELTGLVSFVNHAEYQVQVGRRIRVPDNIAQIARISDISLIMNYATHIVDVTIFDQLARAQWGLIYYPTVVQLNNLREFDAAKYLADQYINIYFHLNQVAQDNAIDGSIMTEDEEIASIFHQQIRQIKTTNTEIILNLKSLKRNTCKIYEIIGMSAAQEKEMLRDIADTHCVTRNPQTYSLAEQWVIFLNMPRLFKEIPAAAIEPSILCAMLDCINNAAEEESAKNKNSLTLTDVFETILQNVSEEDKQVLIFYDAACTKYLKWSTNALFAVIEMHSSLESIKNLEFADYPRSKPLPEEVQMAVFNSLQVISCIRPPFSRRLQERVINTAFDFARIGSYREYVALLEELAPLDAAAQNLLLDVLFDFRDGPTAPNEKITIEMSMQILAEIGRSALSSTTKLVPTGHPATCSSTTKLMRDASPALRAAVFMANPSCYSAWNNKTAQDRHIFEKIMNIMAVNINDMRNSDDITSVSSDFFRKKRHAPSIQISSPIAAVSVVESPNELRIRHINRHTIVNHDDYLQRAERQRSVNQKHLDEEKRMLDYYSGGNPNALSYQRDDDDTHPY